MRFGPTSMPNQPATSRRIRVVVSGWEEGPKVTGLTERVFRLIGLRSQTQIDWRCDILEKAAHIREKAARLASTSESDAEALRRRHG